MTASPAPAAGRRCARRVLHGLKICEGELDPVENQVGAVVATVCRRCGNRVDVLLTAPERGLL